MDGQEYTTRLDGPAVASRPRTAPVGESAPSGRQSGKGKAAAIIAVLLAGVTAVWAVLKSIDTPAGGSSSLAASATGDPQWHEVKPKTFDITVVASGELDAKNKVILKNEVEGKTTITEIVDEGTRVQKGDVLIRLADDAIKKQIEDSEELVQKGQADKIASEQDLLIEKSEAESLRRAEEVKLALAELELAKWNKGTVVAKRRDLDLAIVEAVDNLRITRRNAEESKKLFDAKFISEGEYDDDQLKLKKAIAAEEKAREDKQIYEDFIYKQEEKKFNSDVEEARATLDRVIRKNTSKIARATATYEAAVRTAQLREERLTKLKEQLAFCTIRAPGEGIVVYSTSTGSSRNRRSEPIRKNVEVAFNEAIIILPDTSQMIAILKVNESRMPDIVAGQRVSINIDAMRGRTLDGTVFLKATMADEGSWWNPDVRQYEVRVDLPPNIGTTGSTTTTQADPERKGKRPGGGGRSERGSESPTAGPVQLNPGMRCNGTIIIDKVENALAVPVHAVFSKGRDRFCYVRRGDGLVDMRPVRIGKSNETDVEIRDGLKAGEFVLLRDPKPGEVYVPPTKEEKDSEPKEATRPGQPAPPEGKPGKSRPPESSP
ncbi:MAG: hypothetical protein WD768_06870 [Phycisphaeraceae bacterium]